MIEDNKKIKVTNRSRGVVGYTIPDLGNLTREYRSGETKEVTFEELKKLYWQNGGSRLIEECLLIHDEDAVKELIPNPELEYFYSEEDIKNLLLNGTLDELKDCLDFAPDGVIDLIKKLSLELKINDVEKREAIREVTHLDITTALRLEKENQEDDSKSNIEEKKRRVVSSTDQNQPKRRVQSSDYKVVKMYK